jgi:hypothetical protein
MATKMYANFYDGDDECLYSVLIRTEKEGEKLADYIYSTDKKVEDWTITNKPIGTVMEV